MKKMKRAFAALLALCCVLPLTACSLNISEKPVGPTDDPAHAPTAQTARPGYALALASYPEQAGYPEEDGYFGENGEFDSEKYDEVYDKWMADVQERHAAIRQYPGALDGFLDKSIREFMSGTEGGNAVYSPLNVYMALAMLAETAGGESRQQILDLLGAPDIETLRMTAAALWRGNYIDDGAVKSLMANSLWLNEDVKFVQPTLDLLAEEYYASSFAGRMGDPDFDRALQDWINENTGGLLKEQASGLHMDPETVMSIASTIYFKGRWASEFNKNATAKDVFKLPGGDELECDFMHKSGVNDYFWSDSFAAVPLGIEGSGCMWLILPDEGASPESLIESGEATDFLLRNGDWGNRKRLIVNMAVPKFDVSSKTDLVAGLKRLGVTDVFDASAADFTPSTGELDGTFVTNIEHAARAKIDEEGVEAAAYTVIVRAGGAMPPEEQVDFILDRPFIFAITGEDGLPLFVGIVNNPAA